MIVIFISQCDKKAITKTSRVLDTFADRIGDRTWRTIITNEGLLAVKKLLKKTASKNSSVACHCIHGKNSFELLWIVGNRGRFDNQGRVPVGITKRDIINTQWENNWDYLPLIKVLVALACLFHDWGKSSLLFQNKLKGKSNLISDPLRHEWISCLFIVSLVRLSEKKNLDFLSYLGQTDFNSIGLISMVRNVCENDHPFKNLPLVPALLVWLILSHHKLPCIHEKEWIGFGVFSIQEFLSVIQKDWGYLNTDENFFLCFEFPNGLPSDSPECIRQIKKWSTKALDCLPLLDKAHENNILRSILLYSRLSLMYGDYSFSALPKNGHWSSPVNLYANTDNNQYLKQYLDEHLLGVEKEALGMVHMLPIFETDWEYARDIRSLRLKAFPSSKYYWQDIATEKIKCWKKRTMPNDSKEKFGFFAVNMASTGCGKTYANAKIMQALSDDNESLRYVLALGLRTLTLQTGDEYRNRIGLDDTELAVLIGSRAVENLHAQNPEEKRGYYESESTENLFQGEIDFDSAIPESKLSVLLKDDKSKKLIYSPVLACTIDYLMEATESTKGGRWMLPFMRMMSSDLVIDEIDDFSGSDLIAIGRLIHLAGLLGRKVMISSATIPPGLAEGYSRVYQDGWSTYAKTRSISSSIGVAWIDEFGTKVVSSPNSGSSNFRTNHDLFIRKRSKNLTEIEDKKGVRRKGLIIPCSFLFETDSIELRKAQYFEIIKDQTVLLHRKHCQCDSKSGKNVSFGCIRMANINPCIDLAEFLLGANFPADVEVRVMAYHSRQVLLLRSEQEKFLDSVLRSKGQERLETFSNPNIRFHLDNVACKNLIFILVATPVEEVGRDHDFDWAIVEPSSYRSIIQLAGRVRRHRESNGNEPNIAIMQFNLKGLISKPNIPVFCKPGFETTENLLETHDMSLLIQDEPYINSINAIPRICRRKILHHEKSLVDLEHYSIESLLTNYAKKGPESLEGWLSTNYWWMSGMPEYFAPFRPSEQPMQCLFYSFSQSNDPVFGIYEKEFIPTQQTLNIHHKEVNAELLPRLWLVRNYLNSLETQLELTGETRNSASLKYGEIQIPVASGFVYSDQFGMKQTKII
jgi:CRISPR-associated endonuclease/helicase Cas3